MKAKKSMKRKPSAAHGDSLGVTHLRVLRALARGRAMTMSEIGKAAGIQRRTALCAVGPMDPARRREYGATLLEMKLVTPGYTEDQSIVYEITERGRQALKQGLARIGGLPRKRVNNPKGVNS